MTAVTRTRGSRGPRSGGAGRAEEPRLACRIRLADGRVFAGELPAGKHRAIHLGMLHGESEGFVELTPGTRPPGGRLELDRRSRPEHFLMAGARGGPRWLGRALRHAERILDGAYTPRRFDGRPREEIFLGAAPRVGKAGGREHVTASRWLWVDVDDPDRLGRVHEFLTERPAQLIVATAGSGGCHCYWKLREPLSAELLDPDTGELTEPIERANLRLIVALGADRQCQDRSRVLRLAGGPNWKTGAWARIVHADLAVAPYRLSELVGDLPDPDGERYTRPARGRDLARGDPYRRIPAAEYMLRLAGREADRAGMVGCPAPGHRDEHPSCSVRGPHPECWQCQSCGAAGGIYDLASLTLGGPTGRELRGEAFKRARDVVAQTFGELQAKEASSTMRKPTRR